ncbi:hypothetical protein LguiB_000178 [Lonicera macranthoides]
MGVVSNELKPSIPGKRSFRPSSSARQVNEWPISDVSSDLNIEVGAANFALHKVDNAFKALRVSLTIKPINYGF